ncbi:hypothetical protein NEOLEDRAFT_969832 [Neolentinus lepideus HHB14362 ss-1]|uniref:Sucraseferredoxin-like protein n=1 Tax=Neolentinus lepideus HHB14362 ss-1 TaxID=1314782 RepID=A0A165NBA6_9AGAM|nr:hypothetical protein NEOLEDRAFT_969832 [Neolentinus lepideus HHB14362 ss-1]
MATSIPRNMFRRTVGYRTYSTRADKPTLHGTVVPHHLYVFLHSNVPPMEAPSRLESSVRVSLQRQLLSVNGIVNFSWAKDQPADERSERYKATAYSRAGGRLDIEEITTENFEETVVLLLQKHSRGEAAQLDDENKYAIDLYVCTHKERDCRCGEHGYAVAQAIQAEVKRRQESGPSNAAHRIRLMGETTHVGGHKYAANVLVYPHGEWLGNVRPEHVPSIVDAVLARPLQPSARNDEPPLLPELWRGRMGLTIDQQIALYTKYVPQE